jgi:RNA-directed DNA polymerase
LQPTTDIPVLLTRADVARHVGTSLRLLTWWIWAYDEDNRYYEFEVARRTGGTARTISAPIKPIKDFQRALLPMLDGAYSPRPHVHGFTRGRSPQTNATMHRGQRWILRIDLKDFFPTVHFGRVRGVFRAHPFDFPEEAATALAQICCHRGVLPQGAPTSPVVSNLVCRSLDSELSRLAKSAHCHYTRYADDICFSSGQRVFPGALASIVNQRPVLHPDLRRVIESNNFAINEDKTQLMRWSQRQRVTGIIVNQRLNVPREYRRHIRAVLHIWDKYGEADAVAAFARATIRNWPPEKPPAEFPLVVRGQLQYLGSVRGYDGVYQRLAAELAALDPSFTATAPTVPAPGLVTCATEGPSDPLHLEAATRSFRAGGGFAELDLRRVTHEPPKNDDQLWKWLQKEKDVPHPFPRVGVFDADTGYASKLGAKGWEHLGNGVVAVALVAAPWLSAGQRVCIEMLYPPSVLASFDNEGRRLWLRSDFDEAGLSHDGCYQMQYPQNKTTLVVEKVHPVGDTERSVGLSKVAFADAVWRGQHPFDHVDFEGFRPTLERFWRAAATAQTWCT